MSSKLKLKQEDVNESEWLSDEIEWTKSSKMMRNKESSSSTHFMEVYERFGEDTRGSFGSVHHSM